MWIQTLLRVCSVKFDFRLFFFMLISTLHWAGMGNTICKSLFHNCETAGIDHLLSKHDKYQCHQTFELCASFAQSGGSTTPPYQAAVEQLQRITKSYTPLEKLECVGKHFCSTCVLVFWLSAIPWLIFFFILFHFRRSCVHVFLLRVASNLGLVDE